MVARAAIPGGGTCIGAKLHHTMRNGGARKGMAVIIRADKDINLLCVVLGFGRPHNSRKIQNHNGR